jgi:hypothetical protein
MSGEDHSTETSSTPPPQTTSPEPDTERFDKGQFHESERGVFLGPPPEPVSVNPTQISPPVNLSPAPAADVVPPQSTGQSNEPAPAEPET